MMAEPNYRPQPLQQQDPSPMDPEHDPTQVLEYTPNFSSIFSSTADRRASCIPETSNSNCPMPPGSSQTGQQGNPNPASMILEPRRPQVQFQMPQTSVSSGHIPSSMQTHNIFHENSMLNQILSSNDNQSAHYPPPQTVSHPPQQQHAHLQVSQQPQNQPQTYNYLPPATQPYGAPQSDPNSPRSTTCSMQSCYNQYSNYPIQSNQQNPTQLPLPVRMALIQRCQSYIPPPTYVNLTNQGPRRGRPTSRMYIRPELTRQPSPIPLIQATTNPALRTANQVNQTILRTNDNTDGYTMNNANPSIQNQTASTLVSSPSGHFIPPSNIIRQVAPSHTLNPRFHNTPISSQNQVQPPAVSQNDQLIASRRTYQRTPISRPRAASHSNNQSAQSIPINLTAPAEQTIVPSTNHTQTQTQTCRPESQLPKSTPVSVSSTTRVNVTSVENIDSVQRSATETSNKACQARIQLYEQRSVGLMVSVETLDAECQTDFVERTKPEVKTYVDRASSPILIPGQLRFKTTPKRRKVDHPIPDSGAADGSDDEINVIE